MNKSAQIYIEPVFTTADYKRKLKSMKISEIDELIKYENITQEQLKNYARDRSITKNIKICVLVNHKFAAMKKEGITVICSGRATRKGSSNYDMLIEK